MGDIELDAEKLVRKGGRTAAVTTETIQLVYSHAKLPGVEGETLEYTHDFHTCTFPTAAIPGGLFRIGITV